MPPYLQFCDRMQTLIEQLRNSYSMISIEQMDQASKLPNAAKDAIHEHETKTWAANVSTPALQPSWKSFLDVIKSDKQTLTERDVLLVTGFLSSTDALDVYERLKDNKSVTQIQFINMLNRFSERPELSGPILSSAASELIEQFKVCYRTKVYPDVYNPQKMNLLLRAITSVEQHR